VGTDITRVPFHIGSHAGAFGSSGDLWLILELV